MKKKKKSLKPLRTLIIIITSIRTIKVSAYCVAVCLLDFYHPLSLSEVTAPALTLVVSNINIVSTFPFCSRSHCLTSTAFDGAHVA